MTIEHNQNHPRHEEVERIVLQLARDNIRLKYADNWFIVDSVMIYAGLDHDEMPYLIVCSVDEFCEDHREMMEDYAEEYGSNAAGGRA